MKYLTSTLGCKVNQYETQALETLLNERGHEQGEPADVVIINTCAVTAESGRKSRQAINRLRKENPGALVAVCGCYSQIESPEADIVFGTNDKLKFVEAIEKGVAARVVDDPFTRHEFEILPAGAVDGRTRAMLKIQDGCHNFCTYCIIPYTRGRLRSLPVEEAVSETRRIAAEGYKEIVFTGIEVASYGVDLEGKPGLADVICACAEVSGDMRIRLGSLEPTVITESFCSRLAATGKLCRHFHLSLQSGCDRTLKAMNRKYNCNEFYSACELLRRYFPGCALTCDLITGFPGETEEDFADTLAFIRKCGFSAMHIFPYSRRPGTPADKMPGQLTMKVKEERLHAARQVADEMHREFLESYVGETVPVLMESNDQGHTDTYVLVKAKGALRNELVNVKITGIERDFLYGTCV